VCSSLALDWSQIEKIFMRTAWRVSTVGLSENCLIESAAATSKEGN